MSANQPTAAWAGPGDPLVVVAGHLVSPQDGFGDIGRMANQDLRRPNEIYSAGRIYAIIEQRTSRFSGAATQRLRRANGTEVAPTAVQDGDAIGRFLYSPHDGTAFRDQAEIQALATEDHTAIARGTRFRFLTTLTGATALAARFGFSGAGHFIAEADATYDIGASGVNRPRDLFLSRDLTMGGNALIGTATAATGSPRLDVVGENSFDLPTMVGAQRIDDLADKWFAIAVRHDAIAEEPFIMIAGLSSGMANIVMYGGGTALVAGSVNAATRHEWYTAADDTTIRGTLSASLAGVGATSLFHALGNLRIGALSGTNVSVGVNDSGGAGFKLLRVPN